MDEKENIENEIKENTFPINLDEEAKKVFLKELGIEEEEDDEDYANYLNEKMKYCNKNYEAREEIFEKLKKGEITTKLAYEKLILLFKEGCKLEEEFNKNYKNTAKSLIKILMKQIEKTNEQCALWFISILNKAKYGNLSIENLLEIATKQIPNIVDLCNNHIETM